MGKRIHAASLGLVGTVLSASPGLARDLHDFGAPPDGDAPSGNIVADQHGNLFGTTYFGGLRKCGGGVGCGVIFESLRPGAGPAPWTTKTLYAFTKGADGGFPQSPITQARDGTIYGTTRFGAGAPGGNLFRLTPPVPPGKAWTFENLYLFQGQADGALSNYGSNLLLYRGAVYGITPTGGSSPACTGGCGTVFRLLPPLSGQTAWRYKAVFSFPGGSGGSAPTWFIGPDSIGTFYASTGDRNGAVVAVRPPAKGGAQWSEEIIARFGGQQDGKRPDYLVLGAGGTIFGAAGVPGGGEVFALTPPAMQGAPWTKTVVYALAGGFAFPGSLALRPDGELAGTFFGEIDGNIGSVWTLSPPAQKGEPYLYTKVPESALPSRNPVNVVFGHAGRLFGVMGGGDSDSGALFETPK